MKKKHLPIPLLLLAFLLPTSSQAELTIWVNNGQDKVTKDELRATSNADSVTNSVWDGSTISVFGAKNEVIAFNLILESPTQATNNVRVSIGSLTGPNGFIISGRAVDTNDLADDLFDYNGRNIELFYVRYLQIKGLSTMSYESCYYDERHAPKRFQRPNGQGSWYDRPDHDKYYPEIAVPLEIHTPFSIAADSNQSIWADIFIPENAPAGGFTGTVTIEEGIGASKKRRDIPVLLTVKNFVLPDIPTAKTMLVGGGIEGDAAYRYTGEAWPNPGTPEYDKMVTISTRHCQSAHRHKISLLQGTGRTPDNLTAIAKDQLTGNLFTSARGYDGPGIGTGVNILSIGTYGSWQSSWFDGDTTDEGRKQKMQANADIWVDWFNAQNFTTPTEYFLYLIDESSDYAQTEKWAGWLKNNPGTGKELNSFATLGARKAVVETPSLNVTASWGTINVLEDWDTIAAHYYNDPNKKIYLYNGVRRERGSYATDDEGISLRVQSWAQYKKKIDRWFFWHCTYYDDYQSGMGQTNVFQSARTFGIDDTLIVDGNAWGRTGWNYTNGDGVLFYPGTETHFTEENYGINGPFVSLRMKLWRRGLQDVDYLAMASTVNATQTATIIDRIVPKVLWEQGTGELSDPNDPTWVKHDISWSYDPDVWEAARVELADIIEQSGVISGNGQMPGTFLLKDVFPNPFSRATTITFLLPSKQKVSIHVFNSQGRLVKALLKNKNMVSGIHSVKWDGRDENSRYAASGIYYVRLKSENYQVTKKVTAVR